MVKKYVALSQAEVKTGSEKVNFITTATTASSSTTATAEATTTTSTTASTKNGSCSKPKKVQQVKNS